MINTKIVSLPKKKKENGNYRRCKHFNNCVLLNPTWTLTKRLEKKLFANCIRMLRVDLKKTPQSSTVQNSSCTATCHSAHKETVQINMPYMGSKELIWEVLFFFLHIKSPRRKGIIIYYIATAAAAAFVCLQFIPYRIPECSVRSKSWRVEVRQ